MAGQVHQDLVAADAGHRSLDGLPGSKWPECLFLALDLGQQLSHGLGCHERGGRHLTCHRRRMHAALSLESTCPSFRGWEVRPVNSTARWPERLEHAATLLRAEGAAVVALRGGEFTTLFSYRIDPGIDWTA